jgi:hypothetical protein
MQMFSLSVLCEESESIILENDQRQVFFITLFPMLVVVVPSSRITTATPIDIRTYTTSFYY